MANIDVFINLRQGMELCVNRVDDEANRFTAY